jgi:hypothetical protein
MLNIIKNTINRVFASGVDSDASAFITATGLSGTTQKSAITTLVKDLKSSGLWSKMKAVYPMVTDNYNLLSYTEDFANAAWLNDQASSTANQTIAPNGTNTADKLIENSANNHHLNYQSVSATVGQIYTFSVYLKAAERSYAAIQVADNVVPVNRYTVLVDLINGTILSTRNNNSPTNTSSSIQSVGNGWYRVTATMKQVAGTSFFGHIATSNSATPTYDTIDFPTYTGNGTSGIFIWGAQIELASSVSTYQPILTTPAAFMASQMKYNLKDARDLDAAFRLTWSGGWTYSATGATPNGTNAFADTKLTPSTVLTNNNYHLSHYSRTQKTTGSEIDIGSFTGNPSTVGIALDQFYAGAGKAFVAGDYVSSVITSLASTNTLGFQVNSRTSQTSAKIFFNNSQIGSTLTLSNPNALPNVTFYLGANHSGAAAQEYSSKQVAFASIGDGLTDQDAQLLNQITEKYQVALSRGVQSARSFYYNSAYSNEANTYLYSTQITGTTQVSAINTLINGLKANNLWTKMKAVYPFVTDYRNLWSYTNDVTAVNWIRNNFTASANTTTAPDGTLTADTLIENTANANHYIANQVAAISLSNGNCTMSIYAKKIVRDWFAVSLYDGTTGRIAWFNINNGTIGTVQSGATANISDAGNGWYRCSITMPMSASNINYTSYYGADADNSVVYTGNGVASYYVWGAQLEIGALSTYQPVLAANNYATNVAAQMKFNLVNPQDSDAAFRLAFSGGWTYSTNGAQPNGTNGFADTFLIPNTSLSTSSSHLSFYSRTNTTSGTGYELARTHYALITQFSGNTFYANLETVGSYAASYTSTNGLGHFIASRINNTTTQGFKNGLKVINASQNSSLATSSLIISNNGGANYSNKQTAFVSIGDGFTDAEAALFYQLIQQFQTDLSRQV